MLAWLGDMVKAIHGMKLATEGITLGMIEDGPTTSRSVFDWVPATSAMNDIEGLTGITWNVDYYKVLNFFPAGYFTAPFNITATSHNYSNLKPRTEFRQISQRPSVPPWTTRDNRANGGSNTKARRK